MIGAGQHFTAQRCPEFALRPAGNAYSSGSLLALWRFDTNPTETPSRLRDLGSELTIPHTPTHACKGSSMGKPYGDCNGLV